MKKGRKKVVGAEEMGYNGWSFAVGPLGRGRKNPKRMNMERGKEPIMKSGLGRKSVVFVVFLLICGAAYGQPWDGSGTEGDPYIIATAEDLNKIRKYPTEYDKCFILVNDINMVDYTYDSALIAPNKEGAEPYFYGVPFTGVFDGNGMSIKNFRCHSEQKYYIGIFGCVRGQDAMIKNLGIVDPNITAIGGGYVGALVGALRNDGNISRCFIKGGQLEGASFVGGLVGENQSGFIFESHSTCKVYGVGSGVGGLVGHNYNTHATISSCYSTGDVVTVGFGQYYGGLVGQDSTNTKIINSYSTGNIEADRCVGGLVGFSYSGNISLCYSTGKVSGTEFYGGLIGKFYESEIHHSFWDVNSSGIGMSAGGTGLPTVLMQTESTFTDAGWDFVGEVINGTEDIWKMCDLPDYPRLWWEECPAPANEVPFACIVDADRTVQAGSSCEAKVTLDGSCSSDADSTPGTNDDIVSFEWYLVDVCEPGYEDYLGSGEVIEVNLPLGENTIVLEVTDKAGAFDSNEVVITVEDVTPPEFVLTVEPAELKPHNHQMVLVTPVWDVNDNCDEEVEVSLLSITSSQADDGIGDGKTTDDILITEEGLIYLRAEIGDSSEDRIYTLTFEAADDAGNSTIETAIVTVPQHQLWLHQEAYSGEK